MVGDLGRYWRKVVGRPPGPTDYLLPKPGTSDTAGNFRYTLRDVELFLGHARLATTSVYLAGDLKLGDYFKAI